MKFSDTAEYIFLVFFICETAVRMWAMGHRVYFESSFNRCPDDPPKITPKVWHFDIFQVWLHGHQWKCVRSDLDALQAKGRLVRSLRPQSSQTSQDLQGHQVSLQHGDSVNYDDDDGFNVVFFQFWCTQRPNTFALALTFLTSAKVIFSSLNLLWPKY